MLLPKMLAFGTRPNEHAVLEGASKTPPKPPERVERTSRLRKVFVSRIEQTTQGDFGRLKVSSLYPRQLGEQQLYMHVRVLDPRYAVRKSSGHVTDKAVLAECRSRSEPREEQYTVEYAQPTEWRGRGCRFVGTLVSQVMS